jgi:hypothetical protein
MKSIKYATTGEINWSELKPCGTSYGRREDDAYILFRDKKDISEEERDRLFRLLDAQACYTHAINVMGGRWEKGEQKILKSSTFSYLYALNAIKGRWEEAEDRIAETYFVALAYAKNVIKGRFHKADRYILEKKFKVNFDYKSTMGNDIGILRTRVYNLSGEARIGEPFNFNEWSGYEDMEIRDAYIAELFGERNEEFEKKMAGSKINEKKKWFALARYSNNCTPDTPLPESLHNFMLRGGLENNAHALEYCERFKDDFLKAQTLGFAPQRAKSSSKEKFTDEMKERLSKLVQAEIRVLHPAASGWSGSGEVRDQVADYLHKLRELLKSLGCEIRTQTYRVKTHYPRVGVWEFNARRTRGLVWLEYENGRYHQMRECYWVGIPEDMARRSLAAGKFLTQKVPHP